MTFDALKKKSGRKPYQFVEMDLDYCPLNYGEGKCTAALSIVTISNLLRRSDLFGAVVSWTATGVTVTANVVQSPINFQLFSDRITVDSADSAHSLRQSVSLDSATIGLEHRVSIYVRPETHQFFYIDVNGEYAYYDLYNAKTGIRSNDVTSRVDGVEFGYLKLTMHYTPQNSNPQVVTFGVAEQEGVSSFVATPSSSTVIFGSQLCLASHGHTYVRTVGAQALAQGTGTRSQKCFNTRSTCQDPDSYMGFGAAFDGVDDTVQMASTLNTRIQTNQITVEAMIRPTSGNNGPILVYGDGVTTGPEFWVWEGGSLNAPGGSLYCNVNGVGVHSDYEVLTADKWFHCVWSYDGDVVNFYVDARLVGTSTVGGALRQTINLPINLAARPVDAVFYDGALSHIRVYNRALTMTEVKKRYQDNKLLTNGLILNITANHSTATTVMMDSSTYHHDGVIAGGPLSEVPGPILTKTYRLGKEQGLVPLGISALPCVGSVNVRPSVITPGNGIGTRTSVQVQCRDFPGHDVGIDKYIHERSYDPKTRGTYFGKLLARNKYYSNRNLRVMSGYANDIKQFALTQNIEDLFRERVFNIDSIAGPDQKSRVTIMAKDPLRAIDSDRATAPVASSGRLDADISDVDTSLELNTETDLTEYPVDGGTIRINQEIMTYDSRASYTLNDLTRAQWGTTADDHSADDAVQICVVYFNTNVVDVVFNLFVTYGGVSPSFIPLSEWLAEKASKLQNYNLITVLSDPIGVKDLIEELSLECLLNIYWDETTSFIKLVSLVPNLEGVAIKLNDRTDIIANSVKVKRVPKDRVSRTVFYYGLRNYAERLEIQNMQFIYVDADVSSEGAEQFGSKRIKSIFSRWFGINNRAQAIQTARRMLARLKNEPIIVTFIIDAKDSDLKIGDVIEIETGEIQDDTGASDFVTLQVVSIRELEVDGMSGTHFEVEAQDVLFEGRVGQGGFARIAPDSQVDFTSASDSEKNQYGFIADDNGEMSTGEPGYRVL